jgi:Family of unknown function (DUF5681)
MTGAAKLLINARPKAGAHRWKPGESGNPKGMKRGSRHRATLLAESLYSGECEGLCRKVIELGPRGRRGSTENRDGQTSAAA